MGVKQGYAILSPCGRIMNVKDFSGSTIAIDMMTYIVSLYKIYSINKWYIKVIEFINSLIKNKIECLCVFDGPNKPVEKKKRKVKPEYKNVFSELDMFENGKTEILLQRYPQKSLSEIYSIITDKIQKARTALAFPQEDEIRNVIILLEYFLNCDVYIADGEAENLCCHFLEIGKVDYIMSEDSDLLLYGATKFIMKYNGKTCKYYEMSKILDNHKLSFDELFSLCLLLGTDYNYGIEGLGFAKSYKLIKKESRTTIPNYDRLKEIFTSSPIFTKCNYEESEANSIVRKYLLR